MQLNEAVRFHFRSFIQSEMPPQTRIPRVPKKKGTAVSQPVSMFVSPSCFTMSVMNTAMPTATPACAK